jgi:hypothetical protein
MDLERKYDIEKKRSGASFVCGYCGHRTDVNLFSRTQGNPRTQAATAMNAHIHEAHWQQQIWERRARLEQEQLHPNHILRAR